MNKSGKVGEAAVPWMTNGDVKPDTVDAADHIRKWPKLQEAYLTGWGQRLSEQGCQSELHAEPELISAMQ